MRFLLWTLFSLGLLASLAVTGMIVYLNSRLPDVQVLRDAPLQIPLKIFTTDGELMAEYGHKRRSPVSYPALPEQLIQAIIATEDQRFFEHNGVDIWGLSRAAVAVISTGRKAQGGSTITMQVARNYFLTPERTYKRKFNEILLAFKIERELSKEQIMTLYFNKIFFGNRAYGIAAASQVYYGKTVDKLTLAEVAMLAGLPKAPSKINPIANPIAAKKRRNHVLHRMHTMGFITDKELVETVILPVTAKYHGLPIEVKAPYITEMVRTEIIKRYGRDKAYSSGYKVYTSIRGDYQKAADKALKKGLLEYHRRHGYREQSITIDLDGLPNPDDWLERLADLPQYEGLMPAVVLLVLEQSAHVLQADGKTTVLPWSSMRWARKYISSNRRGPSPKRAADILSRGDVIWLDALQGEAEPMLAQIPVVNGAFVAVSPTDGAIQALVGGFDYFESKFNRATQAKRQPGSNFKPFIYSAALEAGFTAASTINDAPVVFDDQALEDTWRPENYSGKFFGPTRLRTALTKSRNLVSIRLMQQIGIDNAINHASLFGFDTEGLPRNLSLSLGSAEVTPLQLAAGYATFASGGYRVRPYFIERIEDSHGNVLFETSPEEYELEVTDTSQFVDPFNALHDELTLAEPERAISAENAFIVTSMMQDVIKHGTGRKAKVLGRNDLAGKTGTTNDQTDAWFTGYNGDVVATAWVGFDSPQTLGAREIGGRAALPIWIDFMRVALADKPENTLTQPAGIVSVKIDPKTGHRARAGARDAIFEFFREDHIPKRVAYTPPKQQPGKREQMVESVPETLF